MKARERLTPILGLLTAIVGLVAVVVPLLGGYGCPSAALDRDAEEFVSECLDFLIKGDASSIVERSSYPFSNNGNRVARSEAELRRMVENDPPSGQVVLKRLQVKAVREWREEGKLSKSRISRLFTVAVDDEDYIGSATFRYWGPTRGETRSEGWNEDTVYLLVRNHGDTFSLAGTSD